MFLLFLFLIKLTFSLAYDVPPAKVEVFSPKGFEVSIPAEPGITLFGFHGKLNEDFDSLEGGTWAHDIHKAKNGRFTFTDKTSKIKIGDILYYWTYVVYENVGYREEDGKYVVNSYYNKNLNSGSSPPPPPCVVSEPHQKRPTVAPQNNNCHPSITMVNRNQVSCSGQLIFEENFNNQILNSSKWTNENRFSCEPDFEFVMYFKDSKALKIENDLVKIKPYRLRDNDQNALYTKAYNFGPSCTGQLETDECVRTNNDFTILPPLASAQLSTKNNFQFLYGRIEIRARLPNAEWVLPQIYLEPASYNFYGKSNYKSGQMRIAFTHGSNTCNLRGGILLNSNEPFRSAKLCEKRCTTNPWSKDFHVYSLIWQPESINMLVDGEQYCSINPGEGFSTLKINNNELPNVEHLTKGTKLAPFDKEFFLKIGYGVGGLGDFPDGIPYKPWRNEDNQPVFNFWKNMINKYEWLNDDASEFQVDYIRVYSV